MATKKEASTFESINEKMDKKIKLFENFDFGEMELKNAMLRIGTHFFKIEMVENKELTSFKNEIENDLKSKLREKLKDLRTFIDKNMIEYASIVNTIKSEYERKEAILTEKLANSNPMPNITPAQMEKGVSVVPLNRGIGWIVRRTYWPKLVDRKPLKVKLQQKMIKNVLVVIRTEGNLVKEISLKRVSDFGIFDHYHRNCWGDWHWQSKRVNNGDDAIDIANEAMAILENINTMSLAGHNPRGLPAISTVRRNLEEEKVIKPLAKNSNVEDVIELNNDWDATNVNLTLPPIATQTTRTTPPPVVATNVDNEDDGWTTTPVRF